MKKVLIVLFVCVILTVAGVYIWDQYYRSMGNDYFDKSFLEQFDTEHIIDNIEKLVDTGLFEFEESDTMLIPQMQAKWPFGSSLGESPSSIYVQRNASHYYEGSGYTILWEAVEYPEEHSQSHEIYGSDRYKYMYWIYFVAPNGQIIYTQFGNSRKECMDTARETLLWLMSIS